MTNKTTMPEAVAYQWLDTGHFRKKVPADADASAFRSLITTDQAEAYANAMVKQAMEELNNQAQELYESSLKSRLTRDGAADEDELKAIDLWNVESVGMAKAYTNMQKAIRALIPATK